MTVEPGAADPAATDPMRRSGFAYEGRPLRRRRIYTFGPWSLTGVS